MEHPERRAPILTALPVEYAAVRAYLEEVHEEEDAVGTVYEVGSFNANESRWGVCLTQVGAGNVAAATQVERALLHFRPNVAFFVGVAGGVKDVAIVVVVSPFRPTAGRLAPLPSEAVNAYVER